MFLFPFQVGRGIRSRDGNSQVVYDPSLLDRCIYAVSPGCQFTMTFWVKLPEISRIYLLSTNERGTDVSTGLNIRTRVESRDIQMGITITAEILETVDISAGILSSGVWQHIAFAYSLDYDNSTDFAVYVDLIERETSNQTYMTDTYLFEPPLAHMSSGLSTILVNDDYQGFGFLDEVAVFSKALSTSEIMQLQISD